MTSSPFPRAAAAVALATSCFAIAGGSAPQGPTYLGPKPPALVRRVVTLAPALTETVVALGAADRLVGVSRFDELPEVAQLPRVGGFIDPSVESVLALKPDLVLVQPSPGNRQPVEKMAELGAPVLVVTMQSVADILSGIAAIGSALDLPDRARSITTSIERTRASIRAKASQQTPVRTLFIYGFDPLVVAGPGSFTVELLRDAGAVNAAENASSPYQTYSVESAIRSRAEVVIFAADDATGAERLSQLPGLKQARWVRLESKNLLHPGPGLAHGLEELFRLLHGGASGAGVR